jgi:hypothetical protein
MNWIIGALLVLFAIAGGSWGWRKGTKDLASPPERYDRPIGVGRREHERPAAAYAADRCRRPWRRCRRLRLPAGRRHPPLVRLTVVARSRRSCCYANRNVSTISLTAHAHGAFIGARLKRIMT